MLVWTNLTNSANANANLNDMVGGQLGWTDGNSLSLVGNTAGVTTADGYTSLTIPLQFSFCRNPGLALPLIALQYRDVEIVVNYESRANCARQGADITASTINADLRVDYIFLDTEERKNFAQNPHEYLIETVQEQSQGVLAPLPVVLD